MDTSKRLFRSRNRMLGGVAGGVAEYFGIDPTLVRIGLVLLGFVLNFPLLLTYILLWVLMPLQPAVD